MFPESDGQVLIFKPTMMSGPKRVERAKVPTLKLGEYRQRPEWQNKTDLTGGVKVKRVQDPLWPKDGDLVEEVTNEVAEFDVEAEEPKEKKAKKEEKKAKAPKKQTAEEESDDEMEDKEMAYMQKIADEEEEMEKKLEASEDKLEEKLKERKSDDSEDH